MAEQHPPAKVNLSKPTDPLKPLDDAFLTELARGVVTHRYLIVDIDDPSWQRSLGILIQGLKGVPDNTGAIIVPVAPHLKGWWSGNVPAVTVQAHFVPEENLPTFREKLDVMNAALWPDEPGAAPTGSPSTPPAAPE